MLVDGKGWLVREMHDIVKVNGWRLWPIVTSVLSPSPDGLEDSTYTRYTSSMGCPIDYNDASDACQSLLRIKGCPGAQEDADKDGDMGPPTAFKDVSNDACRKAHRKPVLRHIRTSDCQ